MDVIEIAPYAEVVGEVSVLRASSGPNADISDRKQVRGMGDVVDDQRFGSSEPACSADHVWLEYAAQFRIGRFVLVPVPAAGNVLVEIANTMVLLGASGQSFSKALNQSICSSHRLRSF